MISPEDDGSEVHSRVQVHSEEEEEFYFICSICQIEERNELSQCCGRCARGGYLYYQDVSSVDVEVTQ